MIAKKRGPEGPGNSNNAGISSPIAVVRESRYLGELETAAD